MLTDVCELLHNVLKLQPTQKLSLMFYYDDKKQLVSPVVFGLPRTVMSILPVRKRVQSPRPIHLTTCGTSLR